MTQTHPGEITHGMSNTRIYWIWDAMIQRCTNPRNKKYDLYGGRGIEVCPAWRSFEAFYADMGERPLGRSLDRIDTNGHYEPSNCRWATYSEQNANQRPRTHCKHGHEFTDENTIQSFDTGRGRNRRRCATCQREASRAYEARNRGRKAAR